MKTQLLFFGLLSGLVACQNDGDIQPTTTLASEVVGTYQTNQFIDVLTLPVPSDKMPTVELKAESANEVTLIVTKRFPSRETWTLTHAVLSRQPDQSIAITAQGVPVGTLQKDRVFMDNGMEIQGRVLRIRLSGTSVSDEELNFTGFVR
ncbi:hypothetical protein DYU11_04315 [Fibrisoma montanum]|uniref:Lipocalin-like domain-containing protein n=1 Tax=Fibrisoma montanum TaxID=2305895 RepID=A0A418MJ65_9BACT|nr:hypothetical protein [Fibrisoma montanum]RIV27535.1 hypothetical protein DYU11_04315 [Fibrisoma montanum]